jgi:hypothetical protein
MFSGIDYNAYYSPRQIAFIKWYSESYVDYKSLDSFKAANPNYEKHGVSIDQTSNQVFVNAEAGDYHLNPNSLLIGRGHSLPQDIADLVGVVKTPANIGAWPSKK